MAAFFLDLVDWEYLGYNCVQLKCETLKMYLFLANAVLSLHVMIVFFVVLTVPLIFLGGYFKWNFVRYFGLRLAHLACIFVVTIQAWFGVICPLTTLEMWLRKQAGAQTYSGSFIEYWMGELLYWNFPVWIFIVIYSLFAILVIATWVLVPPQKSSKLGKIKQQNI